MLEFARKAIFVDLEQAPRRIIMAVPEAYDLGRIVFADPARLRPWLDQFFSECSTLSENKDVWRGYVAEAFAVAAECIDDSPIVGLRQNPVSLPVVHWSADNNFPFFTCDLMTAAMLVEFGANFVPLLVSRPADSERIQRMFGGAREPESAMAYFVPWEMLPQPEAKLN